VCGCACPAVSAPDVCAVCLGAFVVWHHVRPSATTRSPSSSSFPTPAPTTVRAWPLPRRAVVLGVLVAGPRQAPLAGTRGAHNGAREALAPTCTQAMGESPRRALRRSALMAAGIGARGATAACRDDGYSAPTGTPWPARRRACVQLPLPSCGCGDGEEEGARGKKDIFPLFSPLINKKLIFYWPRCP
jgi:hypothetical protein